MDPSFTRPIVRINLDELNPGNIVLFKNSSYHFVNRQWRGLERFAVRDTGRKINVLEVMSDVWTWTSKMGLRCLFL